MGWDDEDFDDLEVDPERFTIVPYEAHQQIRGFALDSGIDWNWCELVLVEAMKASPPGGYDGPFSWRRFDVEAFFDSVPFDESTEPRGAVGVLLQRFFRWLVDAGVLPHRDGRCLALSVEAWIGDDLHKAEHWQAMSLEPLFLPPPKPRVWN